jgi:microsomal epoxide hydrolase
VGGVQPKSQYFKASDGTQLAYSEAGSGPTIVLVPGWTMPGSIWIWQIKHFAEHFHVVALDPRTQGGSQRSVEINNTERRARDVKDLIDHLKCGPVVLVGWSLAVPELLSYAEQFGGAYVRGYVLVDGFAWEKQDPQFAVSMLGLYRQLNTNRREFTESFVRSMFGKPQQEAFISYLVEESLRVPEDSAIAASVSAIGRPDWTPAIRKIDRPLMVVCQLRLKPMAADLIQRLVPSTRTEFFEGAGHALFVDDAERFNNVLDDFIAHLPADAKSSVSQN